MHATALDTEPTAADRRPNSGRSAADEADGRGTGRPRSQAALVISLDFELQWGLHDLPRVDRYRDNILGARQAIPLMLDVFEEFDVHATWATVGMLMFDNKRALLRSLPSVRPSYRQKGLSAYGYLSHVGASEKDDPLHFGQSLVEQILMTPGQELASHTFSHYYCLAAGQTKDQFRADLESSVDRLKALVGRPRSLVFPRNQWNVNYLPACRDAGLDIVRGNQARWSHEVQGSRLSQAARRLVRWGDAFFSLTADQGINARQLAGVWDVPASRFFRAFGSCPPAIEALRVQRLVKAMDDSFAAGRAFHLWWHPHNFGRHIGQNLQALRQILGHFRVVADRQSIPSCTMAEYADLVRVD